MFLYPFGWLQLVLPEKYSLRYEIKTRSADQTSLGPQNQSLFL